MLEVQWGSSSNSWSISAADFVLQQTSATTCVSALFPIDNSGSSAPAMIWGDTFLKNVYSVFQSSPLQIGFAALSDAAISQSSGDLPVPSATIGAVASVSPTSGSSSSNGAMAAAKVPTSLVVSSVLGSVFAAWASL